MAELTPHPVLIIDDDQELCELLNDWLAVEGFELSAAHDGPSGLAAANQGNFAAIILDVMLPGINGLEILRPRRQSCITPVLMLSARGDAVERILELDQGPAG